MRSDISCVITGPIVKTFHLNCRKISIKRLISPVVGMNALISTRKFSLSLSLNSLSLFEFSEKPESSFLSGLHLDNLVLERSRPIELQEDLVMADSTRMKNMEAQLHQFWSTVSDLQARVDQLELGSNRNHEAIISIDRKLDRVVN